MRKTLQWAASLGFVALCCAALAYSVLAVPRLAAGGIKGLTAAFLERYAANADRECREYDEAVKDPAAARGKQVRWFISHPGNAWLCGDSQNRPISWSGGAPDMPETGQSGQSRGRWVLATVDSVGPKGVCLGLRGLD